MEYFILETIPNDPLNKRVIKVSNVGEAYKLWIQDAVNRKIVKEIELQVIEK